MTNVLITTPAHYVYTEASKALWGLEVREREGLASGNGFNLVTSKSLFTQKGEAADLFSIRINI